MINVTMNCFGATDYARQYAYLLPLFKIPVSMNNELTLAHRHTICKLDQFGKIHANVIDLV